MLQTGNVQFFPGKATYVILFGTEPEQLSKTLNGDDKEWVLSITTEGTM